MMNSSWLQKRLNTHASRETNPLLLRRLRHGVLAFYASTILIVTIATVWLTIQDYHDTLRDTERQSLSLARSLNEHATRSLVSVEQAMQNLVEDFERVGGVDRMDEHWAHERLKSKVERTPQIRGIIAINTHGNLVAHGLEYPTRRINLADRSYFPYHRDHNDQRLHIGEPLISRTDYKWLIPITWRINNSDNSFGGVMLSGVEPEYFLKFYESLHLDRGTRIQVLRSDGVLLLNYPLDISALGANVIDGDVDGFRVVQNKQASFYPGKQYIAQLSNNDMPIIVRVITDPERMLEKYRQNTLARIVSAALLIFALTCMLFLLLRQIRRVENSESRLHLTQFAVDESPDMALWCDPKGKIRYANRMLAELTGHSQSDILMLSFGDLLGAADLRWDRLYVELQLCQRKTMESVIRKKDGSLLPVDLTLSLIADEQEQYLCISARDITERHAAQTELRHHRDHLQELVEERTAEIRTMLDANPLAIVLSADDQMRLVNPAFEALFGYSMNSVLGLPESLIHASAASYLTARSAIQGRISLGATYRGEAELRRSDGSVFWAMLFVRALQPGTHERGVITIIEDVTAQRSAATALRHSEQLKRTILDTTADGFALIDDQRRFVDVNQALCRQLKLTRQAILGQTPEMIWGEALAQQIFPTHQPAMEPASVKSEVVLPTADGPRPALVTRGTINNAHGRTEHIFAFLTDIGHQKEIERSLKEAKEAAESANHAKSIFLTNMSHELRTPMHAVLSFAELGQQRTTGNAPDLSRYFERIQHSGQHLLTLLNDLLDMSRLESDKMTYARARHPLSNTIQAAIGEISSLLSEKQLTVAFDEDQPGIEATYDRVRITQVIINLLSNAIKYSPVGGRIFVRCGDGEASPNGPRMVGFSIRDEGPGVPPDLLEQIFDPFEQATHTPTANGTGLGLTISRRIVEDHGGTIKAHNAPEGGAVFTVSLPADTAAGHDPTTPRPAQ